MRALVLLAFLWLGSGALAGCDLVVEPPWDSAPASEPWTEMLDAVNAARQRGGLCGTAAFPPSGPLAWNGRLERAALDHVADMDAHDRFDHVGSDGSGPGDRARRAGYDWRIVGENIARYQRTVDEVIEDWLESPGHCRQLLDPRYVEMGAAERGQYWAQVFGVPR